MVTTQTTKYNPSNQISTFIPSVVSTLNISQSVNSYSHVNSLISQAKAIQLKDSVIGTFKVMADACVYYSKEKCFKRQTTIGMENQHKKLTERSIREHQKKILASSLLRREERINKRLPYEFHLTDIGILYYLLYVKFLTDPSEIIGVWPDKKTSGRK